MRIEHAALYVNDLKQAKDFFCHYFNGKSNDLYHNQKTGFQSYFITFDDGARLEIMTKPDLGQEDPADPRIGYAHLAFSAGSKEEVDRLSHQLAEDGFSITNGPRTTGDGYYESVIAAIDGIPIEITI